MKKQSFFVITRKGRYSSDEELLWFSDLDKAMEVFKLLIGGLAVNVQEEDVPLVRKKADEYAGSEYLHFIKDEGDYRLESRHIDIYSKEEIDKIKKEREEVNKK